MADAEYLPEFVEALERYSSIKQSANNKIRMVLSNPLGFGEPLKGNLEGLCSCPVKKNFVIIYVYCKECRIKNYQETIGCGNCEETPDERVKFLTIGPHDEAYRVAKKITL